MRAWIGLAIAMLLLAGCSEASDTDEPDERVGTADTPGDGSGTGNGTEAPNVAPTVSITADVTTGVAPLNVTFQVTTADEDGDNVTWIVQLGDGQETNGSGSGPVTHTYDAGNYTVVATATDGNASVEATVNITATAPAPPVEVSSYCEPEGFDEIPPGIYTDGAWVFAETNGVPGLQVENNHPSGQAPFHNAAWEGCTDGDQMLV